MSALKKGQNSEFMLIMTKRGGVDCKKGSVKITSLLIIQLCANRYGINLHWDP